MAGFNTGTLGIPNLRAHAETLRLIRRIIANHGIMHGQAALPWADQEVANYVAFRLMHVRHRADLALRALRRRRCRISRGRRGLVHFWPVPGAAERARVMRDYLERLRAG